MQRKSSGRVNHIQGNVLSKWLTAAGLSHAHPAPFLHAAPHHPPKQRAQRSRHVRARHTYAHTRVCAFQRPDSPVLSRA